MNRYPAIEDLRKRAFRRMPFVAKEYLEQGTDDETIIDLNRKNLDAIRFKPQFLKGDLQPDLKTSLFGKSYDVPFGIAPVGLTSLMWPNTEIFLAQMAKDRNIPYCLSTVAAETMENVSQRVGSNGWFQLYTPRDQSHTYEMLDQAKQNGFKVLVITVDIPYPSRRQRSKRAGFSSPPKITPNLIWQGIMNPVWSLKTVMREIPRLRIIESHSKFKKGANVNEFMSNRIGGNLDWEYINDLKKYWDGPVLLKGILHPKDAHLAVENGMDGIVVSNHGGRQFDGSVSAINALPEIVQVVDGKINVLFDSGIRSGLDIIRALALGADFVLLGRTFCYGTAALGQTGAYHVFQILKEEIEGNMKQLGVETLEQIRELETFKA